MHVLNGSLGGLLLNLPTTWMDPNGTPLGDWGSWKGVKSALGGD